jgi:uncharacterized protein YegP (UPF0339 family)
MPGNGTVGTSCFGSTQMNPQSITTRRTKMAGRIEIRASGGRFRFVVLNRSGEKLLQSAPFDDKSGAKRAASSLTKAVSGAEIIDSTKSSSAGSKSNTGRSGAKG